MLVRDFSLSLDLFSLADTWRSDLGNNPESDWGRSHRTQRREKKRKKIYNAERSHYAVIKEKTSEETSSMNIHVGYFPFMVSVP